MTFIHFFPFPFLICLAVLIVAVIRSRRRRGKRLFGLILFGIYLMALLFVLFFPIAFPSEWPANLTRRHTMQALAEINLIPFRHAAYLINQSAAGALIRDLTMNVILTIPFGFGIAYLKSLKFKQIFLYALAVGISLEGLQLVVKLALGVFYHAIDINDVLMNGLGFLVGAVSYLLVSKIFHLEHGSKEIVAKR